MNYEIAHGQRTHFIQAGNPWAACLDALREEAEEDDVQQAPFRVTSLPTGDEQTIPMAEVLHIQVVAANHCEATTCVKQVAPRMDLTHW